MHALAFVHRVRGPGHDRPVHVRASICMQMRVQCAGKQLDRARYGIICRLLSRRNDRLGVRGWKNNTCLCGR
jgi:hypothetical protein